MALIKCYECSKEISDIAEACPHCGAGKAKECHECSKQISRGLKKCPHCGAPKFSILNSRIIKVILYRVILYTLLLILPILSYAFLFKSSWILISHMFAGTMIWDFHIFTGLICLILTAIVLYAINTNKMVIHKRTRNITIIATIAIIITTTISMHISAYNYHIDKSPKDLSKEITIEMMNDGYTGKGTYTDASGSKYVGEFKDGYRSGQGTYTYPDGAKYVGEFRLSWLHGQGTKTWVSGDKYVGEWKDDKMHGEGTYTTADGKVIKGLFEYNKFIGKTK